ncbi:CBS domain-containing protein [Clostridium lundense]|uniref:CBS domain-containing protein n=1 Tax=Clostridium lundense TaxID=319475 RepID=UPI000480B277|nr:CBS domain-containing protein [Clostridium lundense]
MLIKDIMESNLITVKSEDTLKKALDIMNENKINGTPVIDESGCLAGMIVKADIYRFLIEEGHYDTCPVDWVMTKQVVTGRLEENLIETAKKLRENDIIAMPIIDDENNVKGIITVEDIIDYFIKKVE